MRCKSNHRLQCRVQFVFSVIPVVHCTGVVNGLAAGGNLMQADDETRPSFDPVLTVVLNPDPDHLHQK